MEQLASYRSKVLGSARMPIAVFRALSFTGVGVTLGIFLFGMPAFSQTTVLAPVPVAQTPVSKHEAGAVGDPVRLRIPALGINASVQKVGTGVHGNMAVPQGLAQYRDVAWYRFGVRPGEAGNAVIAGHLDGAFGTNAVFGDLSHLALGDDIAVIDAHNVTHHFIVAAKEEHMSGAVPADRVFGKADTPRLNLITCAGTWDPIGKEYTKRLVVYAIAR